MKINLKRIITLALAVTPSVFTAVRLRALPDTVAVHFGLDGVPDRYGSKYEALLLPAILLILYVLYFLFGKIVLKTSTQDIAKLEANLKVTDTVLLCLYIGLNIINVFFLSCMQTPAIMHSDSALLSVLLTALFGVMFIVMGNLMPKTRRNSWLGMRTRLSMQDDRSWYICNRAAGIAFVAAGFISLLSGILLRSMTAIFVMIIALIITQVLAICYSYVKIKRETNTH